MNDNYHENLAPGFPTPRYEGVALVVVPSRGFAAVFEVAPSRVHCRAAISITRKSRPMEIVELPELKLPKDGDRTDIFKAVESELKRAYHRTLN